MNELKLCPFCGTFVTQYGEIVRHPPSELCILSNQVYQASEWNCRVGEDDLLRRIKEAVEDIEMVARYNSGAGIHAFETITEEVAERVKGLILYRVPEVKEE